MYVFDTHYGHSTLTDDETGICIKWNNGDFNNSQEVATDPTSILPLLSDDDDLASFVAHKLGLMADYIVENYPELV